MTTEDLGILHKLPSVPKSEFKQLLLVQTDSGFEVLYSKSKSNKDWVLFLDETNAFTNQFPDTTGKGFHAILITFEPPILN